MSTSFDFQIKCGDCGRFLDGEFRIIHGELVLQVEPCDNCMDEQWTAGHEEGLKDA